MMTTKERQQHIDRLKMFLSVAKGGKVIEDIVAFEQEIAALEHEERTMAELCVVWRCDLCGEVEQESCKKVDGWTEDNIEEELQHYYARIVSPSGGYPTTRRHQCKEHLNPKFGVMRPIGVRISIL